MLRLTILAEGVARSIFVLLTLRVTISSTQALLVISSLNSGYTRLKAHVGKEVDAGCEDRALMTG